MDAALDLLVGEERKPVFDAGNITRQFYLGDRTTRSRLHPRPDEIAV